jgi:hypothetical protein
VTEDKLTLESGRFDWEVGRGYETPADGGRTLPPGWGDPPEFKDRDVTMPVRPRDGPTQTMAQALDAKITGAPLERIEEIATRGLFEAVGREVMEGIQKVDSLAPPAERVNLDTGTAVFRGHEITLSDDGRAAIKTILAMEVCRVLDEEKARVLEELGIREMFDQEVPGDAGGGAANVPKVPGPAEPVEQEAPRAEGEVQ